MFHVHRMDAIEYLKSLDDESVDLLVTDPPYESLEKHRKKGTTTRLKHSKSSSNDWFDIFKNEKFPELFKEIYRVLKKNSHFYMFCDQETMFVAKPMAEAAGFKFWKPIVWDKKRIGMGYHYRNRYEFILFFEKGKRKLNNLGIPDVLEFPRVNKGYPTEKPVALLEVLISQSTKPVELVVDPFCGSGSSGMAALELGRRFKGCDTSDKAIQLSEKRLSEKFGQICGSLVEEKDNKLTLNDSGKTIQELIKDGSKEILKPRKLTFKEAFELTDHYCPPDLGKLTLKEVFAEARRQVETGPAHEKEIFERNDKLIEKQKELFDNPQRRQIIRQPRAGWPSTEGEHR